MSYGYVATAYGLQPVQPHGQHGHVGRSSADGHAHSHQYPLNHVLVGALSPGIAPLPKASMVQAVKRFFQRYAQFRGYASPSEFWWVVLPLIILDQILLLIFFWVIYIPALANLIAASSVAADRNPAAAEEAAAAAAESNVWLMPAVVLILHIPILLPLLSLLVRRLRDGGIHLLWLLLIAVPRIGGTALLLLCCLPSRPERYRSGGR
ncbi:MAG: DUF805 domain-containing protein [Actinomyces bowdenii]|nr:DUF805 domain-containing protein [Actinomyces bowdenii]